MKANISSDSYVINEGIGGCNGYTFIGRSFPFESWSRLEWPNIVILEFSINIGSDDWRYVFGFLDQITHFLFFKWGKIGLRVPSFVLLLTHRLNSLYIEMENLKTVEERINILSVIKNGKVYLIISHLKF